ncbi:MAG: 2OG-Fe(II) oxygenase family protein [Saprospiraceae bacterium]|nr:2OG-Fe(II) oxygenase family protein [Saprospiraceae bacterium]
MASESEIRLNPSLDIAAAARTLQSNRRVRVSNFFEEETARRLLEEIRNNKVWYATYTQNGENYESEFAKIMALSPQQRAGFIQNIYRRASDSFQFLFLQYYITQAMKQGEDKGHPLHAVHDFFNSQPVLDMARELTGVEEIARSDAFASQYQAGHFLSLHHDTHPTHDRVAAWVVNMSPKWDENWGGYLAFFDEKGNIEEAFKPIFNTFNIFLVPQAHAVQLVSPFAGAPRLGFTGWFMR